MKLARPLLVLLIAVLFASLAHASPETDFWKWFQQNEAALFDFERDQEKTFDRLAAEMHKVHPSLTFEFGPKQGGQREFILSADGVRKAFPKVESLYSSAPVLPKWKIIKFRPRRPPFDIDYNGISIKADSVLVRIQPDAQLAGITIFIPGYTNAAQKSYHGIAFLFLDQALGEYDVETRVGFVDVQAASAAGPNARPIRDLPRLFDEYYAKR